MIAVLLLVCSAVLVQIDGYTVIGGGTQPRENQYNPSGMVELNGGVMEYNGGIEEGGYCNYNSDCRSGLYCTASVNGVKICLSSWNGGGGNDFPTGNGGCQTSANCQYGSVCVVRNGVGNCQIQAGGYV